jgi:hypothetical protein
VSGIQLHCRESNLSLATRPGESNSIVTQGRIDFFAPKNAVSRRSKREKRPKSGSRVRKLGYVHTATDKGAMDQPGGHESQPKTDDSG